MNLLRSIAFVLWLYGSMTLIGLVYAPVLLVSRRAGLGAGRAWAQATLWGARWIVGIRVAVTGRERLPQGSFIAAAKHQSMLDTLMPFLLLQDPAIVLKEELLAAPVFGWYAKNLRMIPVARDANAAALRTLLKAARPAVSEGRQIWIFPEGTRRKPGERGDYRPGVAALYKDLNVPVAPIALDTGRCWPASGLIRRPGVVTVTILDPIPPGLPRPEFMARLETAIDDASDALAAESPPL
ncbi:MAG: 1-acyl-sn-glycerol-3-phosphate acyltransferase [Alphaproteobacteria bacterium]|jgi:1-acyl-sn-glycerol-3-phosphate acyltransferase|nr:1-acyl-sn-glycerol-3-phosphate acyltransferase [Alphaproteobacteria bacterium]